MNKEQLQQMRQAPGFVGALDQSGGSTPKALKAYGIQPDAYQSEEEMFDLIHQMRTRMITSPAFATGKIIGVILFERTMRGKIEGIPTADFLWEKRHIVPFQSFPSISSSRAKPRTSCPAITPSCSPTRWPSRARS